MQNIVGDEFSKVQVESNAFTQEYQEVITIMSGLCSVITSNSRTDSKDKKVKIE